MHERRYYRGTAFLHSPERLARLEVDRVLQLVTMDADIHSVLDVGTGSGVFAEAFAKSGFIVEDNWGQPLIILISAEGNCMNPSIPIHGPAP